MKSATLTEYAGAAASLSVGLLVALGFAFRSEMWIENALFYWLPQLGVIAVFAMYQPPRPAFFAGVALALATYLSLFGFWLFSRQRPESMAWVGYLASLPGAIVGGFFAHKLPMRAIKNPALAVAMAAALATLLGLAASQILVCSTVMYCWGR